MKKLPAYGKTLLAQRRNDTHPLCVHLIVGNDWRAKCVCSWRALGGVHPVLAIHPEDCRTGVFDWRPVTGVSVTVFDQEGLALDFRPADATHEDCWDHGPLYSVLGEIARFAAEVELRSPGLDRPYLAHEIAAALRVRGQMTAEQNHGWPSWWSAEIETSNAKRRYAWQRLVVLERLRPEVCESVR